MHVVYILWGERPDDDVPPVRYAFSTGAELAAFLTGVDEAAGWLEYEMVDPADVTNFQQQEEPTHDETA